MFQNMLFTSISKDASIAFQGICCLSPKLLFRVEKTRSAVADDGWTDRIHLDVKAAINLLPSCDL